MAEAKTKRTAASVEDYIARVEPERRREEAHTLLAMMRRVTGLQPAMWGESMVGFGEYHYKYPSGHEGDSFLTGFSPRKSALTIYIVPGFDAMRDELAKVGPHKTSASCLYLSNLAKIDSARLETIVQKSMAIMKKRFPSWKP